MSFRRLTPAILGINFPISWDDKLIFFDIRENAMMQPSRNKLAFLCAGAIALAVIGGLLVRNYCSTGSFFKYRSEQNGTPGTAAGIVRGSTGFPRAAGNSSPGPKGEAIIFLQEWLKSINNPGEASGPDPIQVITNNLHDYPSGNEAFYRDVRSILLNPSIDLGKKQSLIVALDRAATPAAIQLLADLAQQHLPEDLKRAVLNALSNAGEYGWDKQSIAQVIPELKQLWSQSEDADILRSLATALAKTGNISFLIEAALHNNHSLVDIEKSDDPRAAASWAALQQLHNPDAMPILRDVLQSATDRLEISLSANLLARMGTIEATQALLNWAQGLEDSYSPIVKDAFSRVSTYDSLQYLNTILEQDPPFKSSLVKSAILSKTNK
jgi:hypothetical protein